MLKWGNINLCRFSPDKAVRSKYAVDVLELAIYRNNPKNNALREYIKNLPFRRRKIIAYTRRKIYTKIEKEYPRKRNERGIVLKIKKKLLCFISIVSIAAVGFAGTVRAENTQYWPQEPEIVSPSAIVMEANTGTILYDKNSKEVNYPASITKILTTLLAIENSKMDEVVTFSHDAVFKTEGSGIARDVGEEMTMEQCLYAIMLESANECAYAVGEHVAGDIDSFVKMMNERAAALGCENTHFNNCNGLPDEQHYTSAYDMALIAREAYKNEMFRIICGTKTYRIPFTNKHTDEETFLQNHHAMLYPLKTAKYLYDSCSGGKTGYTTAANYTLVTYAERDGMILICVVMNAPVTANYTDTAALFDYCFDNFKIMNVAENEQAYSKKEQAKDGELNHYEPFVTIDKKGNIVLPMMAEFSDVESKVVYDNKREDVAGSLQYTYAGKIVGSADIVATNAKADTFQFRNKKKAETKGKSKVLQVNVRTIAFAAGGVLLLIAGIFAARKITDKYYKVKRKRKMSQKEKSPYKTIGANQSRKEKRRRRYYGK